MTKIQPSETTTTTATTETKPAKVKIGNRSRKVVIAIIYVALMIDYMLTTVVVPIIPDYLIKLWTEDGSIVLAENETVNYSETSIPVGFLFGSKSVVQIIFNLIAGPLTNRLGYPIVMFVGFILIVVSTIAFGFSKAYWTLFFARSVQGIGSAFTSTAGLGMVAKMYTDEVERGKAIATLLGGLALGALIGPAYGGLTYEYGGILLPFGILAVFALIDGGLQAIILRPTIQREDVEGTHVGKLLIDPYVMITAGAILIANMAISVLEPSLPLWMIEKWNSSSVAQGLVFFPLTLGYLINTQIFGALAHNFGRWKCAMGGMIMIGLAGIMIPFCPNIYFLLLPITLTGLGIGIVDSTMFPTLGTVVDKRHAAAYGSVYAIGDSSVCVAFAAGPFLAGPFVKWFGFKYMMIIMSIINILYTPLLIFLKRLDTMERTDSKANTEENKTKTEETPKDIEGMNNISLSRRSSEVNSPSNQSLNVTMAQIQPASDPPIKDKVTVNNRSRKVVVVIIYVALMIDYMLTTVVVPIIPDYLIKLWIEDGSLILKKNETVDYSETSIPVGLLFGSKSVVQIIFNLIAGPMTNRIGYSLVMFIGFMLLAVSTITFAFSKAYWMMFLARSVQGIGSAFTSTGGLGLVAKMYTDEADRARALASALGGLALGGLIGPSYGGILYEYGGMILPFGILAVLTLIDGGKVSVGVLPIFQGFKQ
ncbi:unnamed protein product [Bursaphelenchus xylophilus]|uniref:(pine wood nematode) hypothetical protein n=1 Tax=Bursaphelenchus xylophilus TaxID=6326 RepID=A0A811M0I2_BURXY|nr:unnamed protein product [Bursaphelenchus xylophilus]CAG9129734.1 unnamed protein product [Bursaphelenchus xylophilus]